jgi:arylsulfatase A-like enzyme
MGDWKLVIHHGVSDSDDTETAPSAKKSVELYNLANDPYEKTNLASTETDRTKSMRTKLDQYAAEAIAAKAKPKGKSFITPKVWGES